MNQSQRAANRQAWVERLERFKVANSTVVQFCERECVSVQSFYQWRRKLSESSKALVSQQASFLPVALAAKTCPEIPAAEEGSATTVLSVDLPGGISVKLEVHSSREKSS